MADRLAVTNNVPPHPNSVELFEEGLRRGRGRAILHLRACDQATRERYREVILTACATDQRYDRQTEPFRGPYLWDVLQATQEPAWYAPHLAARLTAPLLQQKQLAYLCGALTYHDLADFREPLYAACEHDLLAGNTDIAEELLPWEGQTAWRFVLEHAPESIEHWQLWSLFEELGEQHGKQTARHACDDNPALRQAMGALLRQERLERQKNRRRWRSKPEPSPTYANMMDSLYQRHPLPYGWQKDSALIKRLAGAPPTETEALRRWLLLFRTKPFPLDPAPLLALTHHQDRPVAWRALRALAPLTDERIRSRALALAHSQSPLRWAVPLLLAKNSKTSDIALLQTLLDECQEDDALEDFGLSFFRYLEANADALLVPLLLRLFEKTPCSVCRCSFATALHKRGALTPELLEECRWDCNEDTRALVI